MAYGISFSKFLSVKNFFPEIFLAPRGLITILLFYAIPSEITNDRFDPGVLLFIIIASSMAMTFSLVNARKRKELEIPFPGVSLAGKPQVPEDDLKTVPGNNNQ